MEILIEFLLKTILAMTGFTINNLFWISASPEYYAFKKLGLIIPGESFLMMERKKYRTKMSYIFNYRIKTVWSNWRDISSGLIVGLGLTILS